MHDFNRIVWNAWSWAKKQKVSLILLYPYEPYFIVGLSIEFTCTYTVYKSTKWTTYCKIVLKILIIKQKVI